MSQSIISTSKKNNFDFLRFIAALLVIVSHSVPLTGNGTEIFAYISKGQETFGGFAVGIFFVISGYLICGSFIRSKNIWTYFTSRILRIFPALFVAVTISALIIGPLVTNLPLYEYFTNSQTWSYFKVASLYPMQYSLPGVFFSEGKYGHGINGSLWTLSYEFTCYILLAILGATRLLKKELILLLFITTIFLFQFQDIIFLNTKNNTIIPHINQFYFMKFFSQFLSGMIFYLYREQIKFNTKHLLICLAIFFLSIYYGEGYKITFPIFFSYIVFYIAFCEQIKLQNFSKHGDYSYGIYIYGFTIQQCIIKLFGGDMSALLNTLISLPIAIIFGALSWHLVEKKFLGLKNYFPTLKIKST